MVRGSMAPRSPIGAHWLRAVAVSIVVALIIAVVLRGLGHPLGPTFQRRLVHSVAITALATFALSRVMRRFRPIGPAVLWLGLIPILLGVAVMGTGLSCGLLEALGLRYSRTVAACVTDSLSLN